MLLGFRMLDDAQAAGIAEGAVFSPNAYISIDGAGVITLMSPNPEIGQGIKTALPMILAEELNVSWDKVVVNMAPLDAKFGSQVAGGSGAIRGRFTGIRNAGATARVLLITAAAQTWSVPESECYAENGFVLHRPSGKKASYGELTAKAATLPVPSSVTLKDPRDFKIVGTRVHNVDNQKIITGKPLYGIDTRREGMLYAVVARPPAFGKKFKSFDDTETRKVTGVKNVVQAGTVVAVLATSTWAAKKGRDVLKVVWEDVAPLESTAEHDLAFRGLVAKKSTSHARNDGDVDAVFGTAARTVEAVYEVPVLAHATLEPMNFFTDVRDGKAELFGPTQVPASMRSAVASALSIPEANITLGMPRQGGGFGRKLSPDNGVEAALISAAAKAPVQMLWFREDDMQGDLYRPSYLYSYRAAIDDKNEISAWHNSAAVLKSGRATIDGFPAASIPNFRLDSQVLPSAIPTGFWRAPTSNAAAFADECFLDEMAAAMKKDPIALRLELLDKAKNQPAGRVPYDVAKFRGVVETVAQMSNWGKNTNKNVFQGFAAHYAFSTYVAEVAEVTMINGKPRVTRVFAAVNCGRVVNLSGAENQVEGAIIDGLSHALYSKITFDKGAVVQKNFNTYKFARMKDTPPEIVIKFISTDDAPTGLGEPGLPPIAPAAANAYFAATGKRIRKMPFDWDKI